MKIDENLYSIWYENEAGTRFVPDLSGGNPTAAVPEDFRYQHSEMAMYLTHDVLRVARASEVSACAHGNIKPTYGWIDGVEGRKCHDCLGTQTRKVDEPWPEVWSASSSERIFQGSNGYPADLVLAMTRPSPAEEELASMRAREPGYNPVVPRVSSVGKITAINAGYARETGAKVGDEMVMSGPGPKLYNLNDAILIASRACEGCLNVLLWEYGCNDGYPHGSVQHQKAGTSCLFCRPVETIHEAQLRATAQA